ncbi:unnamed protein product [Blepharisma stoltei]|uniref:Globin family profile domain-containing protein n=1 Tax=Blepharisma stoltei TaxID=1481888 RepID=A0AAU9KFV0_9CILI|nr:unnamed protein product [Blepharisma stoltei]
MDRQEYLENHQNLSEFAKDHQLSRSSWNLSILKNKAPVISGLRTELMQNSFIKKLNFLLPKLPEHQKFNVFSHLINNHDSDNNLRLNIPLTLLRVDKMPVSFLIHTKKNGKIISKPCADEEFFNLFKSSEDGPLFYYKAQNHSVVLFSIAKAKALWNSSSQPAMIQQFIKPSSNPVSITRILWKQNAKTKYFLIINLLKFHEKPEDSTIKPQMQLKKNRSYSQLYNFKYTDFIQKTSKSINNPYKIKIQKKSNKSKNLAHTFCNFSGNSIVKASRSLISRSFMELADQENENIINESAEPKGFESFLVQTKNTNSCFAVQSKIKIQEIDTMANQLVSFFNNSVFKGRIIKGVVLDFVQNVDKKWIFLDLQEWITTDKSAVECPGRGKAMKSSERSQSVDHSRNSVYEESESEPDIEENEILQFEKEETNAEKDKLPFKIRKKRISVQKNELNEKDIAERYCKVTQKVNNLKNQSQSAAHLLVNLKEQSIQSYSTIFKTRKINSVHFADHCKNPHLSSNSENNDTSIRKHYTNIINQFDAIKFNSKLSHLRNESLILKYGNSFWNQFIICLFHSILGNDILNKRFKDTKLENFTMIIDGLFKVLNGQVNLEFRRRVRGVHKKLGISEKEFDCFADIFERSLADNKMETQDLQVVMSQTRSMKWLVCNQSHSK